MEQSREAQRILDFIREAGIVKTSELTVQGFHRAILTRLVQNGRLQRLARGVYSVPDHSMTEWHDLAEVCKAVPAARIALISALAFHNIGTQMPYETWIALPVGSWAPQIGHPLRIARLSEPYYSAGIEEHLIEGVTVRVYSAAKTVTDCFRMRSKVGYDVAVEALKEGWRSRKFTMKDISEYARLNRVEKVMRPYIEAIVS